MPNTNTPKISVIVPVYNVEKYIRRCLDSIFAQTFTDWECICVDDGTPDNSGKICDEYAQKDSRFVVIHKENGGVSSARNAGLEVARGEWICFCDSDDWVEREFFEKMLKTENADKAEIIVCGAKDTLGLNTFLIDKKIEKTEWNNALCALFPSVWAKLYRREIIDRNSLRFPLGIKLGEDTFFTYSYLANVRSILYADGNWYNYFVSNTESACHNLSETEILGFKNTVEKLENYIKEKNRLNDFSGSLYNLKLNVKNRFLFSLKKADFDSWRNVFSEINAEILEKEKSSVKFSIFYWLTLKKMDCLAGMILNFHKVFSKIKRGV